MLSYLWKRINKEEKGFTLIELMVVVVILGILSGVGINQYGKVQERARLSADSANLSMLKSAGQLYVLMESISEAKNDIAAELLNMGYIEAQPKSPWAKDEPASGSLHYRVAVVEQGEGEGKILVVKVDNIDKNHPDYKEPETTP